MCCMKLFLKAWDKGNTDFTEIYFDEKTIFSQEPQQTPRHWM